MTETVARRVQRLAEASIPYEWICENCGLRLYSASAETGSDRCPRCGAPLPEPTDAAPLRRAPEGERPPPPDVASPSQRDTAPASEDDVGSSSPHDEEDEGSERG